jgi:hypothetical protein
MIRTVSALLLVGSLVLGGCVILQPEPASTTSVAARPVTRLRVVDPAARPIPGARVGDLGTTDLDGYLELETPAGGIAVVADGYLARLVPEWPPGDIEVVLEPIIVQGVARSPAGEALDGVAVTLGEMEVVTDESGRFEFIAAPAGTIRLYAPGLARAEIEWAGHDTWVPVTLERLLVRALHVSGWAMAGPGRRQHLLDLAMATEINALVVDLKDESGRVFYPSTVALAGSVGAVGDEYTLEEVVNTAADLQLYLIGRIVTFQDPIAGQAAPEMAVWDTTAGAPFQRKGQYFLDPTDPDARQYALDLAVEACAAGFDEIQFDYVRYPDGFDSSAVFDGGADARQRPIVIRDFLAEASALLHPAGCTVAADIFGFITSTRGDGGIGQQLEELAGVVDVLSPMLYPSHYSEGWFGFDVPTDHPRPVVARGLDDGINRLDFPVMLRPWIQDFSYDAAQVREEIEAAEERGLGWMLWNPASRFTEDALLPATGE